MTAMGERILLITLEFGHRAIEAHRLEDRVVPEAPKTLRRHQNLTRAKPFCDLTATIWQCHGGSTKETGAPRRGKRFQFLQQRLEASSIIEADATISGRVDSGSTRQGVDLEPRVVRHARQTRFPSSHPRLGSCILEIVTALLWKPDRRKIGQREHFVSHQNATNLAALPGISRSDDETPLLWTLPLRRCQRISRLDG